MGEQKTEYQSRVSTGKTTAGCRAMKERWLSPWPPPTKGTGGLLAKEKLKLQRVGEGRRAGDGRRGEQRDIGTDIG